MERKRGDFNRSRNDSGTESLTMTGSNVKCRAREWSRRESSDIDCKTRGARVSERGREQIKAFEV